MAERKRWYAVTVTNRETKEKHYCCSCHQYDGGKEAEVFMEWSDDPEDAVLWISPKQAWWKWFRFKHTTDQLVEQYPGTFHDCHAGWKADVEMRISGPAANRNR